LVVEEREEGRRGRREGWRVGVGNVRTINEARFKGKGGEVVGGGEEFPSSRAVMGQLRVGGKRPSESSGVLAEGEREGRIGEGETLVM